VPLVGEPFLASVPLYHGSGTTPLLLARRIEVVAEDKAPPSTIVAVECTAGPRLRRL
jgi:hypothetical protein